MAINLKKGFSFDLDKLAHVTVELGWTPNASPGEEFDLDASAFMLGANGRIPGDKFFVFYNNQTSPDGAVKSDGDDLTGDDGEQLHVDLDRVNPNVQEVLFTVTIYEAASRHQNFGQISSAYIQIRNTDTGNVLARYDLNEDFSTETAVEFARLYRENGVWKFQALGNGRNGGLEALVAKYA